MAVAAGTASLGGVTLFSDLPRRALARVRAASAERRAAPGEVIVREGEPGDALYVILEGAVVVRRNRRRLARLGPGDYFGELALLDGGARSATVEATDPTRLLVLDARGFARVLHEAPGLGPALLVGMARRLRDADARAFT
jgi:CRP/FNR family cyclic AMP-dependent transcriptional regulator